MRYDNYVHGISGVAPERHLDLAEFSAAANLSPNEKSLCEVVAPLSMSQQMLMLCFLSGQIEHSAWEEHLKEDQILAAHFSLMRSSRT